jgi:hypothetical protein
LFLKESVPSEQVVQVKTTTIEEIQPQATVTITEGIKEEEQQTVTTTTQVEEQPLLQVTADVSSTQSKQEEQVSYICYAVLFHIVCCEYINNVRHFRD